MPAGSALRIEAWHHEALLGRADREEVTVSGRRGPPPGKSLRMRPRGMLTLRDAEGQQVIVPNPHIVQPCKPEIRMRISAPTAA